MKRIAAVLLLLLAANAARGASWLPVRDALAVAHESGRLIVLYLSDGRASNDDWAEEWRRSAGSSVADIVLARETSASAALLDILPLRQYFSRTTRDNKVILRRHMVILGPDGETIFSPDSAFRDITEFTATVRALNVQRPSFVLSATFLRDGKVTESTLAKAQGLLGASLLKAADEAFEAAAARAEQEHIATLRQIAQLGHARVQIELWHAASDVYSPRGHTQTENEQGQWTSVLLLIEAVTAHPASNSIAAQAWYLTAIVRTVLRDGEGAGDAYKQAYAFAQKPSPLAENARRNLDMLGIAVPEETGTAAGVVHLTMPRREVMAGTIEVVASAAGASRVDFLLDGARVTERTRAPFTASILLGTLPRAHTIKVAAYDARGRWLGEDAASINDWSPALSVQIVKPHGETIESRTIVELQPHVPGGVQLRSIDLYWNETKIATMIAPPFRYVLTLPVKNASGYLRAVAYDSIGGIAEDATLINAGGLSGSARIDAVELYAIVQDHSGHTIEGLTATDFEVREDGRPVTFELHSASADPITVGIAVDTSGSMRNSMTAVIDYVAEFVKNSLARNDETFLMAFDDEPHLLQPLTSDLQHVRSSLSAVAPSGETAVWDSIIYGLQQLRAVRGKRAFLVFTDGNDNASRTDLGAAIQIAHETAVPVYIVLTYNDETRVTADSAGNKYLRPDTATGSIEQLADATGGAVFRFPKRTDLPKLFSQVRDDTRGEYLLSYVSQSKKPVSEMRKVSIAVPSRHAVVRAITGYYAH
jgi:Ca-activated chloride channel homolog